jgi:hypothetical protein
VLYSSPISLSDPEEVTVLFCNSAEGPLELSGVRERDPGAFQDCKTTLILIDLRGAGVRVAQLAWAEDLMVDEHMDMEDSIWLYSRDLSDGLYHLGLQSYPNPVYVSCGFMAYALGDDGAGEDAQRAEAEKTWELHVRVESYEMVNDSGEPRFLDEVSAAYEFLEPFVQSPSLLEWH